MSELKSGVMRTPHNEGMVFDRGSSRISVTEDETEFYLKSEVDEVIRHQKYNQHCAEIPEVTESKPVTYRELARWLAKGNGEVMWANNVLSNWNYSTDEENKALDESLSVRKWDDMEWHKPTREYLGLEDK